MAEKASNVVLNFKMDGQVQYAQTIREINAIMNTAAKEYKNHVAAMGQDASATDKLRAEKKKLEIQMDAAKKRTEMLRAQYEEMSNSTKTTTGQLAQMYSKLLDSERAESTLQKSLDRVNEGLSEEAIAARGAKEVLNGLQSESKTLEAEQKKLKSAFQLQAAQLGENASESEKVELAQRQLAQQMELTDRVVSNLEQQLEQAKKVYGENSVEVMQLETKLNGAKSTIAEYGNKLESLRTSGNTAEQGLDGVNKKLNAVVFMEAAEAIQGVTDKLLELGKSAMEMGLSFGDSQTNLQANLGLTGKEAKKLNGVVNEVFKNGVVESMDEANQAVVLVKQSFGDLNDTDLENLTNKITTISKRTGTDVNENVRAAKQMMIAFGISGEKAMDLIAAGYQNGLNKSDDFLDTLNEYSPHFKAAGYSADQMLQIIKNGMENGAMNTDKAADAVKEFQIRLGDGSFKKIMGSFSKDTQNTFKEWQKGKATVADVANSVSKDLNKMSPTEQQKALSDLSSQFEDLGVDGAAALFNVGDAFKDTAGKADEMAKKSPGEKWESSLRELKTALLPIGQNLVDAIAPVVDGLAKMGEWFSKLPGPIQTFITVFGGVITVAAVLTPLILGAVAAVGALEISLLPIIGVVAAVAAAIAGIVLVIKNWGTITDWLTDKWNQFKTWISELWNGIKSTATTVFNAIKANMTSIWNSIKSVTSSVWNSIKSTLSVIWNGIKAVASTVWNGIKTYFTSVLNVYKTLFITIWNAIKTAVTTIWNALKTGAATIFNGIKTVITTVWNGIKSITSSVWNGIKAVITSVWNGIKLVTISVANGIKSIVSSVFNGLKSIVSKAMSGVKSAIETGWNKARSFLDGISLIEVGKNIIAGLVKGITSVKDKISSAIKKVADMVPKKFKEILGIHSPSRVMRDEVGYWITEGLAKGIEANTKAEKVAKAKAQQIVSAYKNKLKELDTKYSAGMISTKTYVDSLKKLQKTYGEIAGATTTIQSKIAKANTKQAIKDQKEKQAKQAALAKSFNDQMAKLSYQYSAGILSDSTYIKKLESMKEKYKNVTNATAKIDAKIATIKKTQIAEQFKDDKAYYAAKSKDANVSMQEELNILTKLAKGYKKNSDERIYFENLAKEKKAEITEAKKKIDEDYLEKVKKLNDDYLAEEQRLTEEYQKAVDDRAKSLYSFVGLFDEVNQSTEVSGQQLIANLQGQVDTFKSWAENLKSFAARGVDEGLIKELQDMGPQSAAQIAALTTLSDEELNSYVSLWKEKSSLARTQATEELEGMRIDTAEKIEQLREDAAKKLKEYQDEWKSSMTSVTGNVKNMAKQMPSIGAYAVSGLIEGMKSKKAELQSIADEIANITSSIGGASNNTFALQKLNLGTDWHAKGGIFTRPTIFGMSGGRLQGAGEAGPEAVLPLNEKTLGSIGEAIARTIKGIGNEFNIYTQESPERVIRRELERMAFKA